MLFEYEFTMVLQKWKTTIMVLACFIYYFCKLSFGKCEFIVKCAKKQKFFYQIKELLKTDTSTVIRNTFNHFIEITLTS